MFVTMRNLRDALIPPASAKAWLQEQGIIWKEFLSSGAEVSLDSVPEPFKSKILDIVGEE